MYKGQSIHGFRRGGMQHRKYVEGEPTETIQQQAHIKTPEVAARYLNKRRQGVKLAKLATKVKYQASQAGGSSSSRAMQPPTQRMLVALKAHGLLQ